MEAVREEKMREKLKKMAIYLLLLAFFIPGIIGRRIDAQAAGDSGNDTQAAAEGSTAEAQGETADATQDGTADAQTADGTVAQQ